MKSIKLLPLLMWKSTAVPFMKRKKAKRILMFPQVQRTPVCPRSLQVMLIMVDFEVGMPSHALYTEGRSCKKNCSDKAVGRLLPSSQISISIQYNPSFRPRVGANSFMWATRFTFRL